HADELRNERREAASRLSAARATHDVCGLFQDRFVKEDRVAELRVRPKPEMLPLKRVSGPLKPTNDSVPEMAGAYKFFTRICPLDCFEVQPQRPCARGDQRADDEQRWEHQIQKERILRAPQPAWCALKTNSPKVNRRNEREFDQQEANDCLKQAPDRG